MGRIILNNEEYTGSSGSAPVTDVTVNGSSVVNAQGVAEVTAVQDNPTFTEAQTRANIASGESFATILGKIKKFFTDLKTVAFSGSYNDLTDKPTIPDISTKVSKSGDTMSGDLTFQGSSNDSPDVVFRYDNGNEKMRLWTDDTYTSRKGINYRIYKNDGTSIYSGQLATVADIPDISTKVSKSGDTMSGALTIQNIGDSIVLNRANSNTFSSWIVFKNSSGVIGQYSVDQNGRPRYIANNDPSDIKQIALTSDIQLGSACDNTAYASSDTHYMKLCTITLGQYYEYISLLVTSSFWGNQHGSADIINIQASRGSSSTETGATVQRFHLAGSGGNGSYRDFYYTNSNNTLTLYVYVTGGNSYGSWNISELRLKNVGITYNFTTNVSLPSDASGVYSSTTFDSLTANEFQLTFPGLDFYDPIMGKHMYLIRPGTLTADRSIYLPNKNGTIALLSDISSRRYKENIVPLSDDEAKKLLDVEIVNYDYKEGVVEEDERYDQKGAIAEDVAELIPNAVTYADVDGEQLPDGINYTKFIPYLIKMVQIQQKEIDELKAMIKEK